MSTSPQDSYLKEKGVYLTIYLSKARGLVSFKPTWPSCCYQHLTTSQNDRFKWRVLYVVHLLQMDTRQHKLVASHLININDGSPLLLLFFLMRSMEGAWVIKWKMTCWIVSERLFIKQTWIKQVFNFLIHLYLLSPRQQLMNRTEVRCCVPIKVYTFLCL